MDHQQLFFSTRTYFDSNDEFDSTIGSIDQDFDGFMFSNASVVDDAFDFGIGLPIDTIGESPSFDLSLEEEGCKQNYDEGNSSRKRMKCKRDRSKTLVAERRRSRMKDKLYALRSLVPNITKMDKASIIGDAIVYVQSLKDEAKKLSDDISILESSPTSKDDQIFLRVPIDNMGVKQTEQYHYKKKQCGGKIYTECDGS
ncbi:transcription factor FER-LIKE IRON DEFICIENCY-INDUCED TRANSCRIPTION FACTOR-like [Asparagus officinalis]|uniref:transcription factor FER-LIKE IRON DEFICIENCY-INDUCED TRANSCRIPTION FACTOR-like n=1 Tax=Asparagus officinalis TaxID=4686 RepID=UPI00098E6C85|nr:transcription factor FER-LIKE IRON DEFICIENCY-INDUCED TRANSCRIPTION FACTOR-like [Asparagus officinalis]